jgi:hypothetical protein
MGVTLAVASDSNIVILVCVCAQHTWLLTGKRLPENIGPSKMTSGSEGSNHSFVGGGAWQAFIPWKRRVLSSR